MLMIRRASPRYGPDHHDHAYIKQADRDEPVFAIVLTQIGRGEMMSGKNFSGVGEIQAPLLQRDGTLVWVELDFHLYYRTPSN